MFGRWWKKKHAHRQVRFDAYSFTLQKLFLKCNYCIHSGVPVHVNNDFFLILRASLLDVYGNYINEQFYTSNDTNMETQDSH